MYFPTFYTIKYYSSQPCKMPQKIELLKYILITILNKLIIVKIYPVIIEFNYILITICLFVKAMFFFY